MDNELDFLAAFLSFAFLNGVICFVISFIASQVVPLHPAHIMILIFCIVVVFKVWGGNGR